MCTSSDSHHAAGAADASTNSRERGPAGLSALVRERALELGFDLCRIVPVETAMHIGFFDLWLDLGRAGEMTYLERHTDKRQNPVRLSLKDTAPFRSIIVVAVSYHQFELPASIRNDPSRGIIASYAWADDYHEVIRPLLYEIDSTIRARTGRTTVGKCLVDTGPVLERDWAHRAGIGFTGKNCCTINPEYGSWLFLATVLVPEVLDYDHPISGMGVPTGAAVSPQAVASGLPYSHDFGSWQIPIELDVAMHRAEESSRRTGTCGRCSRCLNDCPTQAFVGPFHLDPQRCISYWTIEARSPIPQALRASFGNRIFGCDICQEVCPWNRRIPERSPLLDGLRANRDRLAPPLLDGFRAQSPYWLNDGAFKMRFHDSPLLRPKRVGMLRNVCVALGNWASPVAFDALCLALQDDEPLARGHAAWALGRIADAHGHEQAVRFLVATVEHESVEWVRLEIFDALSNCTRL